MEVDEPKAGSKSTSYAEQVAQNRALAASGSLDGALQNLMALEKTARLVGTPPPCPPRPLRTARRPRPSTQAADVGGTTELVTAMVEFCWEAKNLTTLNETIVTLSKRRAQLKQAVTKMVQQACKYVEELSSEADKIQLIETLRSISEGKIYVEVERARLTKILADIHEAKGEVEEARKLMQDTTVETLGGMDRREKTEFILEQVRLCLAVEDYIRAHIQIKKIQPKVFADVELDDLKLRYYGMIVRYHVHSANWMEVFRAYQAMWSSPSMTNDDAAASRNLKLQVADLLPSPD